MTATVWIMREVRCNHLQRLPGVAFPTAKRGKDT